MRMLTVDMNDYSMHVVENNNTCQWALVRKKRGADDFVVVSRAYLCLDFFVDDHTYWKMKDKYPGHGQTTTIYGWEPRPKSPCPNNAILMLVKPELVNSVKDHAKHLSSKISVEEVGIDGTIRCNVDNYTERLLIRFPAEFMRHPAYLHALLTYLRSGADHALTVIDYFRKKGRNVKVELNDPKANPKSTIHNAGGCQTLEFYLKRDTLSKGTWKLEPL